MANILLREQRAEYRVRSEALETARLIEIASLTNERALEIIRTLRPFMAIPPDPENGMGLVRQQEIFHRKKSK